MSLPLRGAAVMLGVGVATGAGPGPAADPSTLRGKVLFGYQGWFDNPNSGSQGEGAGGSWGHWCDGERPPAD